MPKRLPIAAARKLAQEHGLRQVIVFAWDGELTHLVTYGATVEDCDQAAQGGEQIRKMFPWFHGPEALPSRVKALKREIADLKKRLSRLEPLAGRGFDHTPMKVLKCR